MTKPTNQQFFEQFRGLDKTTSPLSQDVNSAIEFKNVEKLFNGSLRGRQGSKLCAQPMYVKAIYPYTYTNSEGIVTKELIGAAVIHAGTVGGQHTMVRLKQKSLSLTKGTPLPGLWTAEIKFSDSGLLFRIIDNVDSTVYFTKNLGTGYEASPYTLSDLKAEIESTTDFLLTVPNSAVLDGTVNPAYPSTVLTVDTGHTFVVGDWMPYLNNATSGGETWGEVIATTATTVEITSYDFSNTINDNSLLGHFRFPAAILDLASSIPEVISGSPDTYVPVDLFYNYWEIIPCSLFTNSDTYGTLFIGDPNDTNAALPSFTNRRNCLYFTSNYIESFDYIKDFTSSGGQGLSDADNIKYNAGLWKYDGNNIYLSGFPYDNNSGYPEAFIYLNLAAPSGPTNILAGTYLYQISYLFKDAQNNEFEWFDPRTTSFIWDAYDFDAVEININPMDRILANDYYTVNGFNLRSTKTTALHTAQTVIAVTSGHNIRTGDYVYFTDSSIIITRASAKVIAWTKTSITLDRVATIASGSHISTCLIRIWRTKRQDTQEIAPFYLAHEEPIKLGNTSAETEYIDNTLDVGLGILQSAVKPELIQYPFPKANSVVEHQDILAVAGGDQSRQLVQWEDVNAPESTSKSTTNTPIPTYTSGDLTALVSSSSGSLLCLKPTAQYEIYGSFSDNSIEVQQSIENGTGVSADSALTTVSDILVGASPIGMWADKSGYEFGKALLSFFRDIDISTTVFLRPKRIIVHYDEIKNGVHLILPVEETLTDITSNITSESRHFVYMISPVSDQPSCWVEFSYMLEQFPNAGFATVNDTFYSQSAYLNDSDELTGYLHKRLDSRQLPVGLAESQMFYDNGLSYDWEIITSWDDLGSPKVDKTFEEFVLYSLQSAYTFNDFSVAFESYREWDLTKIDTLRTMLFSKSEDTKEQQFSFDKQYKCKRRAFKLSGSIAGNPPVLSGYEYNVKMRYSNDRMTTS